MKVLDLFSGIGGFSLGLEAAGMETIAFCEKEPFCRADLKKNWPNVPCHNDVTTLDGSKYAGRINVICGGFPCQDISLAGTGKGLAGERSGLWREYHRIIKETKPEWVIIENVSALRSRGLDEVLRSLAEIGYDAEWHCLPASSVGARHRRDRIWIMAYSQGQRYTCGEPANEASQEREIVADPESNGRKQGNEDGRGRDKGTCPRQEQGFTNDGENLAHVDETGCLREGQAQPEERRIYPIASGRGEEMADTHYPLLQRRISRILQERASERSAWQSGTSGVSNTNSAISKGNGAEQDWSQDRLTDPSWWGVKSYVGRRFDGLSAWMDRLDMTQSHKLLMAYADAQKERPEEILLALRCGITPADVWQSFGRSGVVSTQEILFAYVCKLEENHINKTRIQLEGEKTSEDSLRSLRPYQKSASSSYGSGHKKQRREQHPDTLQALSRFLAYHAEKAWVDYCRENAIPYGWEEGISRIAEGVPARVDRIKALGNAIVPQIAQVIGQAIMEYENDRT